MDPLVSELVPVVRSFVPCIKLCYSGVPVDLTFCSFPLDLMTVRLPPQNSTAHGAPAAPR